MGESEILKKVQELVPFQFPSIQFGVESALLDLLNGGVQKYLKNNFYDAGEEIPINGLIWMGTKDFMLDQIEEKLNQGFTCLKMKIGAINFRQELDLLEFIRKKFDASKITIRVDANGAFSKDEALEKLKQLSQFDLHSIEQPIMAGQIEEMKKLCIETPIPIALDEELIGVKDKARLINRINPQFIILKPSLIGGIFHTREWIKQAEINNVGWWMTSALESNLGLNIIAQLPSSTVLHLANRRKEKFVINFLNPHRIYSAQTYPSAWVSLR